MNLAQDSDEGWAEPVFLIEAYCIQDTVDVGILQYKKTFKKNDFGYIVILTDLLVIALFSWFINYLETT